MTLPLFPDFKSLEIDDRSAIEAFTRQFEPYSDFNFTSLWCWNTDNEVAWSVHEGNLIVRLPSYGAGGPPRYTLLGDNDLLVTIRQILTDGTVGDRLSLVPEVVAERLRDGPDFVVVEDRDNADYVVDIANFLNRTGDRYHRIRGDINRFVKHSSPEVIDLDLRLPGDREFVEHIARQWLANHSEDSESMASALASEETAISRGLRLGPDMRGIGILVDDEPYSFKLFEMVGPDWCIGHFAKTAWPLRGATLFGMDAMFARCSAAGVRFYNEEQDLGLPGLRTAKQSHRPSWFLRKHSIALLGSTFAVTT